jgi:PucR family transcriptional regulator, purine catabolism regulatory protein
MLTRQNEMVELFAKRKMAAMAIQTGHYIEEIPASLVNLFSAYNIPLIEIPPDISFKSITRSLMLSLLKS